MLPHDREQLVSAQELQDKPSEFGLIGLQFRREGHCAAGSELIVTKGADYGMF